MGLDGLQCESCVDALPSSLQDGTSGMLLEFWFIFLLLLFHKKRTKTFIYLNIL